MKALLFSALAGLSLSTNIALALTPIQNGIYRAKPAVALEAFQLARSTARDLEPGFAEISKACPKAQQFTDSIEEKIIESNKLVNVSSGSERIRIYVLCDEEQIGESSGRGANVITLNASDILLARSVEEVAFIVAHEMAHQLLGHNEIDACYATLGFDKCSAILGTLNLVTMEHEADAAALRLMARAGLSIGAAHSMFQRFRVASGDCVGVLGKCLINDPHGSAFTSRQKLIDEQISKNRRLVMRETRTSAFEEAQSELQTFRKK